MATNPFYQASGNPGVHSSGMSVVLRAEFKAIQDGFDKMPAFGTTGLFSTVFNQVGDYTFTLPAQSGTLALLTDVAAEATRAKAAETALAATGTALTAETAARVAETQRAKAAEQVLYEDIVTEHERALTAEQAMAAKIVGKQDGLGFTPVQQGGTAKVTFTWTVLGLKCQEDNTDLGYVVTSNAPHGFALADDMAKAYQPLSPGAPYVRNAWGTNQVYVGYSGNQLLARVDLTDFGQIPTANAPGPFIRTHDSADLASLGLTGTLGVAGAFGISGTGPYISNQGSQPTTNQPWNWLIGVSVVNGVTASGFMVSSDRRAKKDIEDIPWADALQWIKAARPRTFTIDGVPSSGFIAQEDLAAGRGAAVTVVPDEREAFRDPDDTGPAGSRLTRNYSHDIAYLTAALQNALQRIEALELEGR